METIQLDIEDPQQLLTYLRQSNLIEPDEQPAMRPLTGGVSNRTVLIERNRLAPLLGILSERL